MISPMLCEPSQPFDSDEWLIEVKWDGERAIAYFENSKITLQNRKGVDVTYRYPELQRMVVGMSCSSCILDGEICVIEDGKSKFNLLAQRSHLQKAFDIELRMKRIPVTFVAFDMLMVNTVDIKARPLDERKILMYEFFHPVPSVPGTSPLVAMWSLPGDEEGRGTVLYEQACQRGLEGIVAKHRESPYLVGKRSPYWKKSKVIKTVDMWFDRYTVNNAGVRVEDQDGNSCQVAGHHAVKVKEAIDKNGRALIEVKHMEITEAGRLRQPTFKALRS